MISIPCPSAFFRLSTVRTCPFSPQQLGALRCLASCTESIETPSRNSRSQQIHPCPSSAAEAQQQRVRVSLPRHNLDTPQRAWTHETAIFTSRLDTEAVKKTQESWYPFVPAILPFQCRCVIFVNTASICSQLTLLSPPTRSPSRESTPFRRATAPPPHTNWKELTSTQWPEPLERLFPACF